LKIFNDSGKQIYFTMTRLRAAIDIGTHTARLLIASDPGPAGPLKALTRRREYVRLTESIDNNDENIIGPGAITRTVRVLEGFLTLIRTYGVQSTHAIATGVIREATNRDEFLGRIYEKTGIPVRPVSGDEEAQLTAKGVLLSRGVQSGPFVIFDLGGGSAEFFFGGNETQTVKSLSLGAAVMTHRHLKSDPPEESEIASLTGYISDILHNGIPDYDTSYKNYKTDARLSVIGTGGTVTTLAMMIHGISEKEISAEYINGLLLNGRQIEALFDKMKGMSVKERLKLPGLDEGRAGIILAGAVIVINILDFFKALQFTVSLSDLLEGILIGYI
jgi:exopolyphosphatase / guanosine-5'-triphosphate,3'-diphosphate pyrophosphatase